MGPCFRRDDTGCVHKSWANFTDPKPLARGTPIPKLPVVPAKAGTHNHRKQFAAHQSDKQIAQVTPLRIFALDQLDLPVALPLLELLLTHNGFLGTLI